MAKKLDLGPTGKRVAERVHHYRERNNLTFAELARRLGDVGHPIPPLGLRRIESEERKVTVDDLTALAVIFDVGPYELLSPPPLEGDDSANVEAQATGTPVLPLNNLRAWIHYGHGKYLDPAYDRDAQNAEIKQRIEDDRRGESELLRRLRELSEAYQLIYEAKKIEADRGDD